MLKAVKLTTDKNFSWCTSVNGALTNEEIAQYFINNYFNVGSYPKEDIQKVIRIEFIEEQ